MFYEAGTKYVNEFYVRIFSEVGPTVSTHDAFLHVRPSQMPSAEGHAFGNANALKTDVLFQYLQTHVLPGALEMKRNRARSSPSTPRT